MASETRHMAKEEGSIAAQQPKMPALVASIAALITARPLRRKGITRLLLDIHFSICTSRDEFGPVDRSSQTLFNSRICGSEVNRHLWDYLGYGRLAPVRTDVKKHKVAFCSHNKDALGSHKAASEAELAAARANRMK